MKLEDIAKLAGVSKATVSSVLNGRAEKYRIKPETQARVRKIAEEHGYRPNHSAAALRRGRSHSIGFIIPDFENRSFLRIAKRLEALARDAGYQLIIASSDDSVETEINAARLLVARGVDALLVSSCLTGEAQEYAGITRQGTPVIGLDRPLPPSFSNIVSDDRQGALELTRSLALKGTETVLLLGAAPELEIGQQREAGFRQALAAYPGVEVHCAYASQFDAAPARLALQQAIKVIGRLPDAIITTSFRLLEGVFEYFQQEHEQSAKHSPLSGDSTLQLATFGNSRLLDFIPLQVNSLPQQYERIAESAWDLAWQAMQKPAEPRQVVIPRVLKRRRSTGGAS